MTEFSIKTFLDRGGADGAVDRGLSQRRDAHGDEAGHGLATTSTARPFPTRWGPARRTLLKGAKKVPKGKLFFHRHNGQSLTSHRPYLECDGKCMFGRLRPSSLLPPCGEGGAQRRMRGSISGTRSVNRGVFRGDRPSPGSATGEAIHPLPQGERVLTISPASASRRALLCC